MIINDLPCNLGFKLLEENQNNRKRYNIYRKKMINRAFDKHLLFNFFALVINYTPKQLKYVIREKRLSIRLCKLTFKSPPFLKERIILFHKKCLKLLKKILKNGKRRL